MTEALFEPDRLRMARELREWTQADLAARLDVSPAAISQFESGSTRPAAATISSLAEVLDVPPGFLGMAMIDTHEGFFRSLRRTSVQHRRKARAFAHVAHDLAVESSEPLPPLNLPQLPLVDLDAEDRLIEDAAAHLRNIWGLPRGPVLDVVATLERHGILVIRLPLDTADVDAFSLPFEDRPVVVLGTDKNDKARSRFDAAHELGHLVLHGRQVWGLKEIEQQAHTFAAAFLMPASDIQDELPRTTDWATLFRLKEKWQVSLAALLRRALTLGRMTDGQYLSVMKAVSARGWRRIEPLPLGHPEQPQLWGQLLSTPGGRRAAGVMPQSVVDCLISASCSDGRGGPTNLVVTGIEA